MNTEQPLVSVIVPMYNSEKTIKKCLSTIQNQNFLNLEIILVDDESTDSTLTIVSQITTKDSRCQVIKQANGGAGKARNTGIVHASGDFILFVDADDYLKVNTLESVLKIQSQTQAQVVMFNYSVINIEGNDLEKNNPQRRTFPDNPVRGRVALQLLLQGKLSHYSFQMLYDKKIFSKIRFPEGRIFEDFTVTYQILAVAKKVAFINQKLYVYIQYADSTMHLVKSKYAEDIMKAIDELDQFIDGKYADLKQMAGIYEVPRLLTAYSIAVKGKPRNVVLQKQVRKRILIKAHGLTSSQSLPKADRIKLQLLRFHVLNLLYKFQQVFRSQNDQVVKHY